MDWSAESKPRPLDSIGLFFLPEVSLSINELFFLPSGAGETSCFKDLSFPTAPVDEVACEAPEPPSISPRLPPERINSFWLA